MRVCYRCGVTSALKREAFEASGFAPIFSALIAVDDSANGKLALHLAGMLARSRAIPITVLQLGRRESFPAVETTAAQRVKAAVSGVNQTDDMEARDGNSSL